MTARSREGDVEIRIQCLAELGINKPQTLTVSNPTTEDVRLFIEQEGAYEKTMKQLINYINNSRTRTRTRIQDFPTSTSIEGDDCASRVGRQSDVDDQTSTLADDGDELTIQSVLQATNEAVSALKVKKLRPVVPSNYAPYLAAQHARREPAYDSWSMLEKQAYIGELAQEYKRQIHCDENGMLEAANAFCESRNVPRTLETNNLDSRQKTRLANK